MNTRDLFAAGGLLLCLAASPMLRAQTTDGYHSVQVFPVVVDTASFTQRFTFANPDFAEPLTLRPRYFPGQGTPQPSPITCADIVVPARSTVVVPSLRDLCPALVAGSAFGFLQVSEIQAQPRQFAAFSRVANPAGNGFSVESFPLHTFSSADSAVTGVRRLAASAGAPAFQSNCFVASLNELAPPAASAPVTVDYQVFDAGGNALGQSTVALAPGGFVRLLDVFAAAGLPAGNVDDATVRFHAQAVGYGLMSFCTVQDNTSFGADFRIGKQEIGRAPDSSYGSHDDHLNRETLSDRDTYTNADGLAKQYALANATSRNVHVFYFRHPDWIACEIYNKDTEARATAAYGMEMRLFDGQGQVLAGGSGVTGFSGLYLGDKRVRASGANTRYTIEVQGTGIAFSDRKYALHCSSGSGHTPGDLIRGNLAVPAATEVEPNETFLQADARTLRFDNTPRISGAIGTAADRDVFKGSITSPGTMMRFETFMPDGSDCVTGGTELLLRNSAGTQVAANVSGGIGLCSGFVFPLEDTGTYYIEVGDAGSDGAIPAYVLESARLPNRGAETETAGSSGANETAATAGTQFGTQLEGFVSGDHTLSGVGISDRDFYAIHVPAGMGVRAEVVEGDRASETCEANAVDTELTLYAADGTTVLANNDDGSRGLCSLLDGTGAAPADAGARNNTGVAQVWYLEVRESDFASVGNQDTFVYRLGVTIR